MTVSSTTSKSTGRWGRVHLAELSPDAGGRLNKVKQTAQAVYLVLCAHADRDGIAYPSKETIAAALGIKERAVGAALARLRSAGVIQVHAAGGGWKRSTRYRITPPNGAPPCAVDDENGASSCAVDTNYSAPSDIPQSDIRAR